MAGVDHAFQYSVAVGSRFSLFLDERLNGQDPDILLSQLQSQRAEKRKKEKSSSNQHAKEEPTPSENKSDVPASKIANPPSKPSKPTSSAPPREDVPVSPLKHENSAVPVNRERGIGRGTRFRGPRSQGPQPSMTADKSNETTPNREQAYETRGRGRPRGRGTFGRGRGITFAGNRDSEHSLAQGSKPFKKDVSGVGEAANDGNTSENDDVTVGAKESGDQAPGGLSVRPENGVEDEEPKSYTLEEYKAMQLSKKAAVLTSSRSSRKANDGQDVFANMVAHRKVQEVHSEESEGKENLPEVQTLDIDFSFNDGYGARGRRGRGSSSRPSNFYREGRGRDRPGRGRGVNRGDGRARGSARSFNSSNNVPPPAIYNDQEFPSLK